MTALYDQAMHGMDEDILGVLRNRLKDPSFAKRTVVVVTSDHGEEFMEHGQFLHNTLYDFNTQVPLVFFIPGVRPHTVTEHVQSVDIAPTILDIIGVHQFSPMNGTSLTAPIRGISLSTRLIIANGNAYREKDRSTIRENDWILFIKTEADGTVVPYELYNTKDDPNELTNMLTQNLQKAKDILQKYKTASFIHP
jgi:arylsulfatase A-like enzyme